MYYINSIRAKNPEDVGVGTDDLRRAAFCG